MTRSRRKHRRDRKRLRRYLLRKLEWRRMLDCAFWDRERGEKVVLGSYPFFNVAHGEVLFDRKGYLNPSLQQENKKTEDVKKLHEP